MNIAPIPYEKNAKKHSQEQLYKLATSIRDFGWMQPIVVDKANVILAGHGRWEAYIQYAGEMNLPEPRIEIASDLTDEQANAYRLADNLLSSQDYDAEQLQENINQLPLPFQEMLLFGETTKEDKTEKTKITDEAYLKYLNNTIRQIVMHYEQGEYDGIMEKQEKLKAKYGFETASELYKKLIDDAHAKDNPTT